MADEGVWYGPDKVAHFMFAPCLTGWGLVFAPSAAWAWIVLVSAILLGIAWEASNHWWVLRGQRGISALDLVAFLAGDVLAFLLMVTQTVGGHAITNVLTMARAVGL